MVGDHMGILSAVVLQFAPVAWWEVVRKLNQVSKLSNHVRKTVIW
jgi:hypothetical protein